MASLEEKKDYLVRQFMQPATNSKSLVLILLDLQYLQLWTLLIIGSFCPSSHHWASLELHFPGLNIYIICNTSEQTKNNSGKE